MEIVTDAEKWYFMKGNHCLSCRSPYIKDEDMKEKLEKVLGRIIYRGE